MKLLSPCIRDAVSLPYSILTVAQIIEEKGGEACMPDTASRAAHEMGMQCCTAIRPYLPSSWPLGQGHHACRDKLLSRTTKTVLGQLEPCRLMDA